MQAPTHLLLGVWLEGATRARVRRAPLRVGIVLLAGVVSHLVLDDLAGLTYHPPGGPRDGVAWLLLHVGFLAVGLAVLWRWRGAWLGMLAAVLPDADWVVLRPLAWLGFVPEAWVGGVHEALRAILGLGAIHAGLAAALPDWREVPWAAGVEGVLMVGLAWAAWRLE